MSPASPHPFVVMVDDNAHHQDAGERQRRGTYATFEEARAACEGLVDEFLAATLRSGVEPEALLAYYRSWGEDPFIVSEDPSAGAFSAWTYAEQRCEVLRIPRPG